MANYPSTGSTQLTAAAAEGDLRSEATVDQEALQPLLPEAAETLSQVRNLMMPLCFHLGIL
jgi:hypothetical protein